MRKIKFANDHIYHICNKGVEERKIFLDDFDYLRFIHDLFEFNNQNPASNIYYRQSQSYEIGTYKIKSEPRKLLVEILIFCLMPNHYHLLLRQKVDNGIYKFMSKLGIGYAMYFNHKYKRNGTLFQGRYKAVLVENEAHFIHLPYYIHLNPLDLVTPEWRKRELKNFKKVIKFLETYRWSSYLDYMGKKNFPSVTQRDFLLEYFGGPKNYKKEVEKWLKELDLEKFYNLTLE